MHQLPSLTGLLTISGQVVRLLAIPGAYLCYRGMQRGGQVIFRYLFWYFNINVLVQALTWARRLLLPQQPTLEWITAHAGLTNGLNLAVTLIGQLAVVLLVYGCYQAFQLGADA